MSSFVLIVPLREEPGKKSPAAVAHVQVFQGSLNESSIASRPARVPPPSRIAAATTGSEKSAERGGGGGGVTIEEWDGGGGGERRRQRRRKSGSVALD